MTELDLSELTERLSRLGVSSPRPLAGGASSLTFSARLDGRPVVVKVAPPGLEPVLHRDVLRQARVMGVLTPTEVPVPRVLLEDAGDPPVVPPLFVMSFVEGESLEPLFDVDRRSASPDSDVSDRLRRAITVMATLHRIDIVAVGLGEEPVSGPAEEIDRWSRLLETVDPSLVPGWSELAGSLRHSLPEPVRPAIVHGDFRLGNMIVRGRAIEAVIDWEIWSVGDPRHDLAWLMMFTDPVMQRAGRRDAANRAAAAAMPEAGVLLADYLGHAHLAQAPPDLEWFRALAHYKLGATMAVLAKRNRRLAEPDPGLELAARTTPPMLERARQLLG